VLVGPADDASPVAAAAPAKMMLGYSGGGAAGDVQEIIFVVPCWVSTESLLIDKGNKVVSTSSHCFLFMRTTTLLHTLLQVQCSCTVLLLGIPVHLAARQGQVSQCQSGQRSLVVSET